MIINLNRHFHKCVLLVTRIVAQGEKHDVLMHLDVNTEIYPMSKGDKFLMVLTPMLNCNGYPGSDNKPQVILSNKPFLVMNQATVAIQHAVNQVK